MVLALKIGIFWNDMVKEIIALVNEVDVFIEITAF
jgi:hypothetical protein